MHWIGRLHETRSLDRPIAKMRAAAALLLVAVAIPAWGQVGSTTLFSDDFGRTTGLGSNWNVAFGSFTTDGNYAIFWNPISKR